MTSAAASEIDIDVLIVGAGPVGLLLANECARRGLRWRLVEARASQSEYSKALAIFPRTLEILDMAGLVAPFLDAANRVNAVALSVHGRSLARLSFAPAESPYPFIAMVPQDVTERLLVEQLQRRGGAVEYDTSFVDAVEHDEHVSVTLERKGEPLGVKASFVVGCDGAHSAVRHLLKLTFEGAQYTASFMLADIETNDALPADELQLCPSAAGPVAIFPMSATRRRIVAMIDRPEGDAPSLELVQRILRERAPAAIEAHALRWSSYFRVHHRHVKTMHVGRIFIAGDAAHIHSPFGGQGMNTGMHDAWNLAWKLDLVVRGASDRSLLDSYDVERLPPIEKVITTTHLLTRVLGSSNTIAQALRNTVLPIVSRAARFQRGFVERLSGLGVAYGGSPIVEGAGERYWDDSLGNGGIRSRFLLLYPGDAGPTLSGELQRLAASMPDVLELRPTARREVTLVRPDGYVAYATRTIDVAASRSVQALMQRQTKAAGAAGRSTTQGINR